MSQLGRCTCGEILSKATGKDNNGKDIEVQICLKCVEGKKGDAVLSKTVRRDKYGLEVLEK